MSFTVGRGRSVLRVSWQHFGKFPRMLLSTPSYFSGPAATQTETTLFSFFPSG